MTALTAHRLVIFDQGDDARHVIDLIHSVEPDSPVLHVPTTRTLAAAVEYLRQWETGDEVIEPDSPWSPADYVERVGEYVITWNPGLGYVSLYHSVDPTALEF